MARVPLSKGKERAKAKIKAGQKANASKPSNFSLYDTQVRFSGGKPVVPAASKKAAAPVKKVETKKVEVKKAEPKKPVTVVNAKGKTIYDPKDRTITTYSSKGKTVTDKNPKSENYGTTVSNKKGTIQKLNANEFGDPKTVIKNKKGASIQYYKKGDPGYRKVVIDKSGYTAYTNEDIYKNDKKGPRYIDRKPETKKVETKKVETKKPAVKPNNKDLINKMTRTGQAYYLDTKSGKVEKNPDVKNTIKKVAEDSKNKQAKIVKSKIESLKRPEIRKETIKKEVVVKPPKATAPTVSQLWQQKTGTSWSEAKKQGLTDGSAAANIALMKKLKSGDVNKESIKASKPGTAASMDTFKKEMEKNVQSELSGETTYAPPVPAMRRGGSIKKMRNGGITKRRK